LTLSVCCLTGDPGPRVAALLGRLRGVADEIVVAADSRVDGNHLAAYASVADRLVRFEYAYSERHLAWLHAQCRGDWILRIDGDEVPSPHLVAELPDLLAQRDVHQYLLPRRWLFPDAEHWLDERPWWPDYQVRLVRNDGQLRFPGLHHTSAVPVRPARYLEAPLLHLDLLITSLDRRETKAERYDRDLAPDREAPGGGSLSARFYVPERWARREPVPLDEVERSAARAVLETPWPPPARVEARPVVGLEESDRLWGSRPLSEDAYRARVAPAETDLRIIAGREDALHFRVENLGHERWPWDTGAGLPLSASYRWRNPSGALLTPDGLRTPFPGWVEPGDAVVVPLNVLAPERPGPYRLEVDLVHEHVRWFGCTTEVWVEVVPAAPSVRMRRSLRSASSRSRGSARPPA
jgi:hypothetical protein